jgi:hypothetical protein
MTMKSYNRPGSSGGRGPMRQWAEKSYDPATGRSASSLDEPGGTGNDAHGSRQLPHGEGHGNAPGFAELDRRRTQGRTPVAKRPIG